MMANGSGDDVLAAIRLRAYFLWEKAGRPAGGDIVFWDDARGQIERERSVEDKIGAAGEPGGADG